MCPVYKTVCGFTARENALPHWRQGGATYELSFSTKNRIPLSEACRQVVMDSFLYWNVKRYQLGIVVVMPDHVHSLLKPKQIDGNEFIDLSRIAHSIKSYTGREINRLSGTTGQVWEREFYNRIIRDREEYLARWNYMLSNPVSAGLCDNFTGYRWVWFDEGVEMHV